MVELDSVATPELKCMFAMVNRIKYTPIADSVNYFKNVHKMLGPIKCTSMVTQIAINLGCPKMANLAYIEGDVPILGLDHFVHVHILREEPDHSYLCCMVTRRSSYLTRAFDWTLLKALHYSLIGWERHTTALQDHLPLAGKLVWRQHSRPRLHHRLTLRSPSGTLGVGVATQVTMRVSLQAGTSTSARYPDWYTPLDWYISYRVDQAEHTIEHQMDDFAHMQMEMQASID
jgi:hypothetical protein